MMKGPDSKDMPQLTALNTKAQDTVWSLISPQFLLNTITPATAITPATDSDWLITRHATRAQPSCNTQCVHRRSTVWQKTTVG